MMNAAAAGECRDVDDRELDIMCMSEVDANTVDSCNTDKPYNERSLVILATTERNTTNDRWFRQAHLSRDG